MPFSLTITSWHCVIEFLVHVIPKVHTYHTYREEYTHRLAPLDSPAENNNTLGSKGVCGVLHV